MQIAVMYMLILSSSARKKKFGRLTNEGQKTTFEHYMEYYMRNGHLVKSKKKINNTPLVCRGWLYGKHGTQITIQTPNYPQNYPNNADCPWLMVVPPYTKITIECEAFDVPQGDFFMVIVISGKKISGNSLKSQTIIFEKTNELIMEFISDSQKTSSGFNCTVSSSYFKKGKRKKIMKWI